MPVKTGNQQNEHGRYLIDNDDRDYAPFLVKRLTPTQRAYADFLADQFGGELGDLDPVRLVYIAVALHNDFQGGTWWNEHKAEYRPGSRFNDGEKPGPKPGNATKAPRPEPYKGRGKPKPERKRRTRDADVKPPY